MINIYTNSVLKSDGNSFYVDVVSDSFNKASTDEDNILEQTYRRRYARIFIMKILNFKSDGAKCILKEIQYITTKDLIKLSFRATGCDSMHF